MLAGFIGNYNFMVDNWGSTYSNTGLGVSVTTGAANTKGSDTNLLNGISEDCYFLQIGFCGGSATTVARRYMADIKIDPAAGSGNAGSSWTTLISNLAAMAPQLGAGWGYWYGFPIYLPAGTAIGAATQCSTASVTCRHLIRVFGKPSEPELLRVGTKVQTLGASTGTTVGTTVTPGTSAKGSYSATLGTLSLPSWWFQCGVLTTDTSMTAAGYLFDVAVETTTKYLVIRDMPYAVVGTTEQACKAMSGVAPPIFSAPSGVDVFVRGVSCPAAPDSSMSAIVYAVQ